MSRTLLDLIARVLLGLYPPAFRARFGPALRRDFVASCCEQPSVSHVAGNVCDLVLNSFAERRYLRHAQ